MFTANTMSSAIEALGLTVPNSAAPVAPSELRVQKAYETGLAVMKVLKSDTKPRDILTRQAFENAISVIAAMGGSTNSVLHLLAIAYEAGLGLTIDDIERVGKNVPELADLKPAGKYVMADVDKIGGVPVVMKLLNDGGFLHGDARTVTGETQGERLAGVAYPDGQDVVRPLSNPVRVTGGFAIMRGNVAPDGGVLKITGASKNLHRGPAKVFDREEDAYQAIMDRRIAAGDARSHCGDSRPGSKGLGSVDNRWKVLRSLSRNDDRPRLTRSICRRDHRSIEGWRHHYN
jgi:dihydroxy-acid dehydratase